MAFLEEDGTGLTAANSLISVAFFRAHHLDRGRDTLVGTYSDTLVEQAAVKATDFTEMRFGTKYLGTTQSSTQGLSWPRLSAIDADGFLLNGVPSKLQKAVAEYTYIVLKLAELLPVPARAGSSINLTTLAVEENGGGRILEKAEEVGDLKEKTKYEGSIPNADSAVKSFIVADVNIPEYPQADLWIAELIKNASVTTLVRGD